MGKTEEFLHKIKEKRRRGGIPLNQIYPRGDGGQMALYQEGNRVAAVSLPYRRLGQPAVQKRDCLEELTSVLFQGRIYFAYCNLEHQVAMDAVGGGRGQIVLTEQREESRFCNLCLTVREEQLVLLYQAWNPEREQFELRAFAPYLTGPSRRIGELGPSPGRCRILEWQGKLFLLTEAENRQKGRIFFWKSLWEWQEISWEEGINLKSSVEWKREKVQWEQEKVQWEQERAQWEQEKVQWEQERAQWEQEKVQREQREAQLTERENALQEREAQLLSPRQEYQNRLEDLRREYEAQLESARTQYQELAGMAAQLQQIGKMWRDKCYQMEGREL